MTTMMIAPALALGASMIGVAQAPVAPETQVVAYADLDLHSARDQARLEQRVRSAADRLCREDDRASPAGGYLNAACFRAALADGVRQIRLVLGTTENRLASAQPPISLSRR